MTKFLLLNKESVIIDMVDSIRYVKKNSNGLTVLCTFKDAEGYIGSDETIYSKAGKQLKDDFTDIYSFAQAEVPDTVTARSYKYTDGKFTENTDVYPDEYTSADATKLKDNGAHIDYIAMMTEVTL